ncbi:hypothetical protein J7K99_05450 [bacterium]|nr:hypothetical protein [bacterium]
MWRERLLIVFPICPFVSILMGNSFVDNGPNPGELYIVGPDIPLDSSEYTFLYYSPDTGRTLIVKDTLSEILSIAADDSEGVLYLSSTFGLYRSFNYGVSWEFFSPLEGYLHSGVKEGEFAHNFGRWSIDYGSSLFIGALNGWVRIPAGDADVGVQPGALFVLVYDGVVVATLDYSDHYDTVFTLPNGGIIRSGAEGRERCLQS